MTVWPESVERVTAFIRAAGAEARVEEFPEGTSSAADAARAVGCSAAQIVKSLLFDCDGRFVLVLVPGDRRVDTAKLSLGVGCTSARPARAEHVFAVTGFEPGAVAPFPLPAIERVLLDPSLLLHRVVWIGAGSGRHVAALTPPELVRLARAQVVEVVTGE
jgi:prolyl-tRNA editing enzyme YbaK/EbsC (Cys-tRNA(Pro) deacylase)